MTITLILLTVLAPAFTQYVNVALSGMRPDVTFNAENERFDVGNIIADQNQQFPEPMKYRREDGDARRLFRKILSRRKDKDASSDITSLEDETYSNPYDQLPTQKVKQEFEPHLNFKFNKTQSGFTGDFAYHDKMESGEYNTDYEKHLIPFQISRRKADRLVESLHGGQIDGRRNMAADPEAEILFHHAVPVKMTINGFLVPETNHELN